MNWRCLNSGSQTGEQNMAHDEAIFAEVEKGFSPPTIRIYGWQPACISLGYAQDPQKELNLSAMVEAGIDWVKRPTGGRAVLHIEEFTYAVIAPLHVTPWCLSRESSYRKISEALIYALDFAGLEMLDREGASEKPGGPKAMTPCFSSTAKSEVTWQGRKFVGSAQRRSRHVFLQHGSVLLSQKHEQLVKYLQINQDQRSVYAEHLRNHAVTLEEIAGRPILFQDLAKDFLHRFTTYLELPYKESDLTEREKALAESLVKKQHYLKQNIYSPNSVPNVSKESVIPEGLIC